MHGPADSCHGHQRACVHRQHVTVGLLNDLHVRGIMTCGTVRANRNGLPTTFLPKNVRLQRGDFKRAQKDDLAYVIWMDTKAVITLSNVHDRPHQGTVLD